MDTRRNTRHELAVLATALVVASRPLEGDLVWLIGLLVLAAVVLGGFQALDLGEPRGVAIESVVTPAVAAAASVGAIRLVPVGLWLVPAVVLIFILIDRALAVETNLIARPGEPAREDRNALLAVALTSAFLAFAGATDAAGVGRSAVGGATTGTSEASLLALVMADAVIAGLLGFRLALLESPSLTDAAWGAITFAAVAAIGTGGARAVDLPRLVGPALLTLLLYLWSFYARRPQGFGGGHRRRIAEAGVLAFLGLAVAGWNLLLRP